MSDLDAFNLPARSWSERRERLREQDPDYPLRARVSYLKDRINERAPFASQRRRENEAELRELLRQLQERNTHCRYG